MGYYTTYTLEVSDPDLIPILRAENENAQYTLDDHGRPQDPCKWYDHETDLKAFSKKHPKALFTLKGEGEESGDIWIEYYMNGKVQVCKAEVTFAPYDPRQMK